MNRNPKLFIIILMMLFGNFIILPSCSNLNMTTGYEYKRKSFGEKISYSKIPGDNNLFEENANLSLLKIANKVNNDKDYSDYLDDEFDDDLDNSNKKKKHNKKSKKPKHWQKIAFENEPQISMSLLRQLTNCPVPKLNLTKPTITTNVEWQIFVYCVLDILPEEGDERHKKDPKKHGKKHKISKNKHKDHDDYESSYPEIEDMRKHKSAYKFIKKALKKYLKKYLFHNSDLTNEQKFAMFERIFLVTKFRMLTQNEKAMVEDLIARKGLYYTTIIYRLNWYFSEFYQDHFDFSQDPQEEYESYEIYGKIVNELSEPVDNLKYSIPGDEIYGFQTSGISQTKSTFIEKVKKFFSEEQTFLHNFHLQFYLPKDIIENAQSETQDMEIPVLVEQNNTYEVKFASIKLTGSITTNVNIVLNKIPDTPPGEPVPTWPQDVTTPNPDTESLSWNVNPSGALGECSAPSLITSGDITVIDGYAWQDFLTCYLKVDISKIMAGWDYYPLNNKDSAFSLMLSVLEQHKVSELSIYKTDIEMAAAILEAVTFRQAGPAELSMIAASIEKTGLDETYMSLLEKWYYSSEYSYYDYTQYNMPALTWHTIKGNVNDSNGTPLANVNIKLQNLSGIELEQTNTNNLGEYNFRIKVAEASYGQKLKLVVTYDGYQEREIFFTLSGSKLINQEILLNPLGKVTQSTGGQIVSASNEVVINIPSGAVTNDVQFTMTEPELVEIPELSQTDGAYFEITPSYTFDQPVNVTINIENLRAKYLDAKSWYVFIKSEDGAWEMVENVIFDADTNTLLVSLNHFSVIYISQINPNSTIPDPRGDVFERKTITYPTDVPSLIPYRPPKAPGWRLEYICAR